MRPISFLLGIVLCLPIIFGAQTTQDCVLTIGLVSRAWDYARFCQMYLNHGIYGGVRVMEESSIRQATSVTVRSGWVYPSPLQIEQRRLQPRWYYRRDSRGLGIDIGYGLGWTIAGDGTLVHAGVWETFAWVDPNRDIVGIILTQNVGGRNPGIEFINVVNAAVVEGIDNSTR